MFLSFEYDKQGYITRVIDYKFIYNVTGDIAYRSYVISDKLRLIYQVYNKYSTSYLAKNIARLYILSYGDRDGDTIGEYINTDRRYSKPIKRIIPCIQRYYDTYNKRGLTNPKLFKLSAGLE